MKKLSFVAIALFIGTSMAFASSLGVPWFIDNAGENVGIPPNEKGTMTLIFLKNTTSDTLELQVTYFNSAGDNLGAAHPDPAVTGPGSNTFAIAPQSALAFRPTAIDPSGITTDPRDGALGEPLGQEGPQGVLVPNRPRDVDTKFNGSATIQWVGSPESVVGQVTFYQTEEDGSVLSYAHLLPSGAA